MWPLVGATLSPSARDVERAVAVQAGEESVEEIGPDEAFQRVEAGFQAWASVTGGRVHWQVRRASGATLRYGALNVSVCAAGAPLLADASGRHAGGATSGDVLVLASNWIDTKELSALVAHEAGHALGLPDSDRLDAVMNPSLPIEAPAKADLAAFDTITRTADSSR